MQNQILEQQLFDRWDTLPTILKEAIVSETNSLVAVKAAEDEHLPKEKIGIVLKLAGYVLMGFLHPEDIAKEIQDALGINPNIAATISNTLNSRVFSPLRDDLEKIYAPAVSESNPPAVSETQRPVMVEEIIKPSTPVKTISEVKPSIAPKPGAVTFPFGPTGPKIISTGTIPTPPPVPSVPSTVNFPKPPKPISLSQVSDVKGQMSEVVGPVILHQESELTPIKSVSGFKLEIPMPKFNETKSELGIPPKPAQIEIGSTPPIPPRQGSRVMGPAFGEAPAVAKAMADKSAGRQEPAAAPPRVVHYSESRTPLVPSRVERLAPEKISQVPKPPSPPKPAEAVVKKDYLPDPLKELELPKPESLKPPPPPSKISISNDQLMK